MRRNSFLGVTKPMACAVYRDPCWQGWQVPARTVSSCTTRSSSPSSSMARVHCAHSHNASANSPFSWASLEQGTKRPAGTC